MFRDLRERPLTNDVEADLCIVGAGAAGITIARRFQGTGVSVCLVESGGMRADAAVQDMYRGETTGAPYELDSSRLRFFGGTTNHWTGVCGMQDPLDFEPRPWIQSPGWPITRDALLPFYQRAHEILDVGRFEYDPAKIAPERAFPPFDPAKLSIGALRFSPPTRFNQKYQAEIASSPNITCLLNANLVDFETTQAGSRVSAIRIASLGGGDWRVRSKAFVLACGGLENPRLLLNASTTPDGLGNAHGLVGRYFADHLHHRDTGVVVASGDWWKCFEPVTQDQRTASLMISLADDLQRREGLLDCRAGLWRTETPVGAREDAVCLSIYGNCEQLPSPDNRVTLSDERDALGLRRIRLHWTISETERRTMRRWVVVIAEELGRLKLGHVRMAARLDRRPRIHKRIWRASHHMGTTRMSDSPGAGVVDPDCRMHQVENLYVAGSSVFPACGHINPTLTIVALALRLGDHLAERLGAHRAGHAAPGPKQGDLP